MIKVQLLTCHNEHFLSFLHAQDFCIFLILFGLKLVILRFQHHIRFFHKFDIHCV